MSRPVPHALFALLSIASCAFGIARAAAPHSPGECEVWARELGFARAVAEHDAAAFAEHIASGAVFGAGGDRQRRGRDAIAQAWAGIVEGREITIEWYPTRTTVGGEAGIAWSQGPSLVVLAPGTDRAEYRLGRFHSVWRRGEDGVWRVLFDDGVEGVPATPEQVRAFREGRRETCPAG
ncbi:MAG: YybH family protein [Pseudomonadota bacterium]